MQSYHVTASDTTHHLGNQPEATPDIDALSWLAHLADSSNADVLDHLDSLTATCEVNPTSNQPMAYPPDMSSVQNHLSSAPDHLASNNAEGIYQFSHMPSSVQESSSAGYNSTLLNSNQGHLNTSVPFEHINNMASFVPVTSQQGMNPNRSMPMQNNGHAYNFNVFDYANFRHQLPQADTVVTQQPQSSAHQQEESHDQNSEQENQLQTINQPQSSSSNMYGIPVQSSVAQPVASSHTTSPSSDEKPQMSTMSLIQSAMNEADIIPHNLPESPVKQHQVATHNLPPVLNKSQAVDQQAPIRVPQPNHLISPLLASQSRPQLPLGLRNSNYLVHPIIARPSTQPSVASVQSKDEQSLNTEESQQHDNQGKSGKDENVVSSTIAENTSQMHLNQFAGVAGPIASQHQSPGHQPNYDRNMYGNAHQPDVQIKNTPAQPVHSTEFLLQGGHVSDTSVSQPVSSQPSQSGSSDSSDDGTEKPDAGIHSDEDHLTSEHPQPDHQPQPVNFWEQHTAASRLSGSGVAHPKPVRLPAGYPSMFPPSAFPWANGGMCQQPFNQGFPVGMTNVHQDQKVQNGNPQLSQGHPSTTHDETATAQPVKEEPQQPAYSQSENLGDFLSDFPKSLESLSSLQSQPNVSWPSMQHRPLEAPAVPTFASSEIKSETPGLQTGGMFSNNTFMSPSFFTHHVHGRHTMSMPPMSSTPEATPSPTNSKASDDDSAIDVNPGSSSSTSPSSSIDSRSSPELLALHLQNEDSNSSVSEPSLLMSRSSSVSSICDSSISSTASSSNSSFTVPRGKRPNPDPDMGGYKKKSRTSYTPGQLRALERVYMENPYPECDTIDRLARELDIPEQRLRVWFQNKRARMRRQAKQNKQAAPHPPVNPYNAQPMSAIMSSASPYSFLPPNSMMAPGQTNQMMQRPYFPFPQGAPPPMMQHGGNMPSAPGMPQQPPLLPQQPLSLTPQQSQIQRLYSFIAHKNQH